MSSRVTSDEPDTPTELVQRTGLQHSPGTSTSGGADGNVVADRQQYRLSRLQLWHWQPLVSVASGQGASAVQCQD